MISNGTLHPSGYYKFGIAGKQWFVHRLVAFTFLGPPPDQQAWQVHHRDGNSSNNRVENLEYATASQNMLYSWAIDTSRRNSGAKLSVPVMWRIVGSQRWTTSASMRQAAAELGMSTFSVWNGCQQGKRSKGYEFQLAKLDEVAALEQEEWRQMCDPMSGVPVAGRLVSSLGRIKAQNGRISYGCLTKTGYYMTGLRLEFSQSRNESVHRLVAYAFLGPPLNHKRSHVNHKNLNKGDNAVENLEYVTPGENHLHSLLNGDRVPRWDGKPLESRKLESSDEWMWHPSVCSAAKALELNNSNIFHCLAGRTKHAGGFEFRRAKTCESEAFAGEEWRKVDINALLQERALRQKFKLWPGRILICFDPHDGPNHTEFIKQWLL